MIFTLTNDILSIKHKKEEKQKNVLEKKGGRGSKYFQWNLFSIVSKYLTKWKKLCEYKNNFPYMI